MRTSLERNSTFECLTFTMLTMRDEFDDDDIDIVGLARLRETLSFLRINASLKSLTLVCEDTADHDVISVLKRCPRL
jgi:hypothetical protein